MHVRQSHEMIGRRWCWAGFTERSGVDRNQTLVDAMIPPRQSNGAHQRDTKVGSLCTKTKHAHFKTNFWWTSAFSLAIMSETCWKLHKTKEEEEMKRYHTCNSTKTVRLQNMVYITIRMIYCEYIVLRSQSVVNLWLHTHTQNVS